MIDKAQLNRVLMANQLPLNRVAATFLEGGAMPTEMAVLTLMRWGLLEAINITPRMGGPDADQLMTQITLMTDWEPRNAMAFLTNPERLEGEVVLDADQLAAETTPGDAAGLLLENLYSAMETTAP